jgi:hypothetical protein
VPSGEIFVENRDILAPGYVLGVVFDWTGRGSLTSSRRGCSDTCGKLSDEATAPGAPVWPELSYMQNTPWRAQLLHTGLASLHYHDVNACPSATLTQKGLG